VHEELSPHGFTVISVALDRSADDARPWIERAAPSHPSLVDTQWTVADLYNVVNVPTVVWIDEDGRIVRPNDVFYATDTYRSLTGIDSAAALARVRAWVRDGVVGIDPAAAPDLQSLPTESDQLARAEFGLARFLAMDGRAEAAEPHFRRAGELAPHDFTIRRGSMPMRGIDPRGPAFVEMLGEWIGAGNPYYRPLPEKR
jgi:hypothetical protein